MAVSTATRLRTLAAASRHEGTVSLYLGVDGHERPRLADCLSAFDSLAHEARLLASQQGEAVEASVRADLDLIHSVVAGLKRRGARGLVFVSCHATGCFEVIRLPVRVEDAVTVGDVPDLGQLERLVDRTDRFVVALVDREHTRLFRYTSAGLATLEEDVITLPRRHDQGGWSASSLQRHTDELGRRHLSRAAGRVRAFLTADPQARLLLGGPEEDAAVFIEELRPDLRHRLAGRVSVRIAAGLDEIADAVAASVKTAGEPRDTIATLRSAIGTGVGVAGLAATLDALTARRCAVLVTSPALRVPGWTCPACGALSAAAGSCRCGAPLERCDDIEPAVTAAAIVSDCRVVWVDDADALSDLGGIGAILRF